MGDGENGGDKKQNQPLKFWMWEYKKMIEERDNGFLAVVEGDIKEFDKVGRWSWYKYELGMEKLREKIQAIEEQNKKRAKK